MNYNNVVRRDNSPAIAWMIHYKDDGQLVVITTDQKKAIYYSGMAYHVTPLYKHD